MFTYVTGLMVNNALYVTGIPHTKFASWSSTLALLQPVDGDALDIEDRGFDLIRAVDGG